MSLDIHTKKLKKNAFRVTKTRNMTALRVRVPGGEITGELLRLVADVAARFGDGRVHMTTRQGFEILGIPHGKMEEVNRVIQPLIDKLDINQNERDTGYSAAGTRNVAACMGNKVCIKAQFNTTELAKKIEKVIFPHDFHFKIALTGCMNDCQKVRMHDFGIFGMALPLYEKDRCVGCESCAKQCKLVSTGALTMVDHKVVRDHEICIGCGECVLCCPTRARTRSPTKYYRLAIMGRTGKKNPRLAEDFLIWTDEESIIKIIMNTYDYVNEYIDRSLPKEHIGYIVHRTGFMEYKKWALKDVVLPEDAIVKHNIYWNGIHYLFHDYLL